MGARKLPPDGAAIKWFGRLVKHWTRELLDMGGDLAQGENLAGEQGRPVALPPRGDLIGIVQRVALLVVDLRVLPEAPGRPYLTGDAEQSLGVAISVCDVRLPCQALCPGLPIGPS